MSARILPPEEWGRLGGRAVSLLLPYVRPSDLKVAVVEDAGQIVATLGICRMTHLEGIWIDPAHRNAGVTRGLVRESVRAAREWSDGWAIGGAADEHMHDIVQRLHGTRLPLDFYALSLGGEPCQPQ